MSSGRPSLGAGRVVSAGAGSSGAERGSAVRVPAPRTCEQDLRPRGRPCPGTAPPRAGPAAFAPCSLRRWEELIGGTPALYCRFWEHVTRSTEACGAQGAPRLDNTDCFVPLLEAEAL